jgi:hypothetical protein
MDYQEAVWKDKSVVVTGIVSRSGAMHRYLCRYVGRTGYVIGTAKNNMLLVEFAKYRGMETCRAIPAGCVTLSSSIKHAGVRHAYNR